jgi:serine/threonine protein kinase
VLYVADFEISVGVCGTRFWRAPEILGDVKNRRVNPQSFTEKSDVYSYAMTCYKILTGLEPFEREGYPQNNYDVVLEGARPKLPRDINPCFAELLTRCWHTEPSERPTFEEIVGILEKIEPSAKENLPLAAVKKL